MLSDSVVLSLSKLTSLSTRPTLLVATVGITADYPCVTTVADCFAIVRAEKAGERTASELTSVGPGSCISLIADLQQVADIERLVKELSSREKHLNILVGDSCYLSIYALKQPAMASPG